MKKVLLLLTCTLVLCIKVMAQTTDTVPEFNEKTIVKDSTGKILNFNYWHPLLLSGNYSMERTYTKTDTSDYILSWLSPAQKKQFAQLNATYTGSNGQTTTTASNAVAGTTPATQLYIPTRLPQKSESFTNGEIFEPFKERDIDGKKIDIKALQGKILVINFWFIGCPACMAEIPELNEAVANYANDPNVVFIGMCLDERWDIKKFLKATPFNFQHIAAVQNYEKQYKVRLYPTTVVLDKQNIIRFNSVGSDNTGYWIKKTVEDIKHGGLTQN